MSGARAGPRVLGLARGERHCQAVRGRDPKQDAEIRLDRGDLALALRAHAVIAMKDSAGLDDDEEIVATVEWAAGALLRAALHDFEQPQ